MRKLRAIWDLLFTKSEWVIIEYNETGFSVNFSHDITVANIEACQLFLEIGKGEIANMETAVNEANKIING